MGHSAYISNDITDVGAMRPFVMPSAMRDTIGAYMYSSTATLTLLEIHVIHDDDYFHVAEWLSNMRAWW